MSRTQREAQVRKLHHEAPLVDTHIHPSLKAWLFDRSLSDRGFSTSFLNPFSDRASLTKAREGGFRVLFVAHHVPEQGLFERSRWLNWAVRTLGLEEKLTAGEPYARMNEMMDLVEGDVHTHQNVSLARNLVELRESLKKDDLVLLHAVEGGHVLNGEPERLDELAERGVVSLTLTHFFPNGLARNVDAIPDSFLVKGLGDFALGDDDADDLTEYGKDVLDRMRDCGVIPDLTHTAPEARRAIYNYVPSTTPLVATHLGLQEFCPDPMNLTDDELEEIADRDGAVGLIFFKYFLNRGSNQSILKDLWESIRHVRTVTGSWDHIMIGTDFDGFTSPSYELKDASDMPTFTKTLLDRGLPEDAIRKILGANAMRVVESFWGEGTASGGTPDTGRDVDQSDA